MNPNPNEDVVLGKYKGRLDDKYMLYQTLGKGQYAK